MRFSAIWLLLILLNIACNDSQNKKNTLIAQVGQTTLSLYEFRTQYTEFLSRSGAEDNLLFRNKFLDNEIDRLVILSLADSLKFKKSPDLLQKIKHARNQKILNEFYNRELYDTYQASDSLLRNAFIRSKTDIHARHLYSQSLEKANQLKAKLNDGATFEKLSKEVFRDSVLAGNGGDLGYFSLGDMDPAFEDAAFSLIDGEISDPIITRNGFSIIQVLDRWVEPLITEQDYLLHKDDMNKILRSRNMGRKKQAYTDSLIQSLTLNMTAENLDLHFVLFGQILMNEIEQGKYDDSLLKSTLETWNGIDIVEKLKDLSSAQKDKVQSKEDLRAVLKGIAVREKILELAQKKDWFYQLQFQDKLARVGEDILIRHTISQFLPEKTQSSRHVYQAFIENLRGNFQIHIYQDIVRRMIISS